MSVLQSRRPRRAATQAEQEASTSNTVNVTPANQQNHPSAAKWWGFATVSAGTPTLQVSYNMTSITDTATGQITWTIAIDFSSANWAPWIAVFNPAAQATTYGGTPAAGSLLQSCTKTSDGTLQDPGAWSAGGFGDQA